MCCYTILCHARTGSNLLVSALAQHPAITSHNELFHERTIYYADAQPVRDSDVQQRNHAPIPFLEAVLAQATTPVVGFKHLLFYDGAVIDYVLGQPAFKIILLDRENILAQYSSMQIAHQTSQWTLHRGDTPVSPTTLDWDADDFNAYAADYRRAYAELKQRISASGSAHLNIQYRDLQSTKVFQQVFDFLGVEPIPVDTGVIRKQNTSHIVERFAQPEQVRDYLQKHGLMAWEVEH